MHPEARKLAAPASLGPNRRRAHSMGYLVLQHMGRYRLMTLSTYVPTYVPRWFSVCQRLAKLTHPGPKDLVLMYCSFISLKARNHLTIQCAPRELTLGEEHRLFQAYDSLAYPPAQNTFTWLIRKQRCIFDDGFDHSLIVYHDRATGGFRLHAAVWDGELRQVPVWTAFGTHSYTLPYPLTSTAPSATSRAQTGM
jgi:hypothetical protein